MKYATNELWNTLPPTPEEYEALLKAKAETDAHFRRGVIKSGWHYFGDGRLAWVKRCDIFGYCCGVGDTPGQWAAQKWWIDFPDRQGRVEKKESVFVSRRRVVHHHQLPDQHVYQHRGEVR